MKMIRNSIYLISALLIIVGTNGCRDDDGSFENKLFNTTPKVENILLKGGVAAIEQAVRASIAQPVDYEVTVTYRAEPALHSTYNQAYYDNATLLPARHYQLSEPSVTIPVGSVQSPEVIVQFLNLDELDPDLVYVLPVTIAEANIAILTSARTIYYLIKGSSLINVVPDMEKNYLMPQNLKWNNPGPLSNLESLTLEALVNVRSFEKNNAVTSIMGIEGNFLIRVGDLPIQRNQIEVVTPAGNHRGPVSGIPANEWVHIAVTYKNNDKVAIFVNGEPHGDAANVGSQSISFTDGKDGFYIGRSYDDSRYIEGAITECRIWNVVRTREEIATNIYAVEPDSPGLVAYWKCNEGSGKIIKDHTANGNDLVAVNSIKWMDVSLPK